LQAPVGSRAHTGQAGDVTLDAAAAVARIGGVVSHVSALPAGAPGWHVRVAHIGRGLHPDAVTAPLDAAAASMDPGDAALRAVMKAIERYAAAAWDPATFRWGSAEDLGEDAVAVEELPRAQDLNPRDRIRWVEGWDLVDGRPVWVPAVTAHVGLPPAVEPEGFWPQTLTGCAAHVSLGHAVTTALLEVVEHDAVALTALLGRPLVRLAGAESLLGAAADAGFEVSLFDATTDVAIPVVLAVLSDDERERSVCGSAAAADPVAAGARAISEALCVDALRRANRKTRSEASRAGAGPTVGPLSEFVDSGHTVKLDELAKADVGKPALMRVMRDAGLRAYAVDLTTDELGDVGAVAVRVLVPGLQPQAPNGDLAFVNDRRVARAAAALGLNSAGESPS